MRLKSSESGVALVEFALVLPFLAVILFGVVDLGRAYRFENRLRNAAREGAQVLQTAPNKLDSSCSSLAYDNVKYRVLNEDTGIASLSPTITASKNGTPYWMSASATTCPNPATFAAGDKVTVRVQAPFKVLTPLISNIVGSPLTLTGSQDVDLQR